jgi:two-component system cell cycle sensor histidine kinase/response regulator CckA
MLLMDNSREEFLAMTIAAIRPGVELSFRAVAAPDEAVRSLEAGRERRAKASETILIVEDNAALRRLACRTLAQCGYTVFAAADATEALKVSDEASALDLLLTDIVMPGMSGPMLASELVARRPGLLVLFMSGYTDETVVRHGVLEAGTAFLQKPFTSAGLASKVRQVLDAARG